MRHLLLRAFAYVIDVTLAFAAVMLVVQWLLLNRLRPVFGWTDSWLQDPFHLLFYVLLTISLPVWFYFALLDSRKAGGTIGKRLTRLKVLGENGHQIELGRSLVRTILKLLPWEIAHLGVIFPEPLYFSEDPRVGVLPFLGILLFTLYAVFILVHPSSRTPYDILCRTDVSIAKI